ncbi:uncharacterized protein LOC135157003 isoform X2 [Lytechinus pictus]|uniref:uncharacterized protein LOC135157003 isoform X2 n=1 Tax=Lytechinus pictus TaxID=7653 RepID=UPI0030B9D0C6
MTVSVCEPRAREAVLPRRRCLHLPLAAEKPIMPMCQAFGCSKKQGEHPNHSFFSIPNPVTDRERCAKWLHNIGTDKFNVKTYKYVQSRVVCEDHFEPHCFQEDIRAKVMGYTSKRKLLKPDAVPTLFVHRPIPTPERASTKRRYQELSRKEILQSIPSTSQNVEIDQDLTSDRGHDADISDQTDQQDSDLSDMVLSEGPEPYAFMTVTTEPEVLVKRKSTVLDDTPRKKKRKRRRSGQGNQEESTCKWVVDHATQTFDINRYRKFTSTKVQTDPDCYDCGIQVPELESKMEPEFEVEVEEVEVMTSPLLDHEHYTYTAGTPNRVEMLKVGNIQERPPSPHNPAIVLTPTCMTSSSESVPVPVMSSSNEELSICVPAVSRLVPTSVAKRSAAAPISSDSDVLHTGHTLRQAAWKGKNATDSDFSPPRASHRSSSSPTPPSSDSTSGSNRDQSCVSLPKQAAWKGKNTTDSDFSPPRAPHRRSSSSPTPPSSDSASGSNKDPSYIPSPQASSSSDPDEETWMKYCTDPKYIVFGSQLDRLLHSLQCTKCSGGHISEIQKKVQGSMLTATVLCVCGNIVTRWESHPVIGSASVGNLLCSSSALFSGLSFESLDFFSSVLNMEFVGRTQFFDYQDKYFNAAINSAFKSNLSEARIEVSNSGAPLTVCGDGRCDSPGYNAKYCSYTMMEAKTSKIVAMNLVQVSEATSSNAMEKIGFQRALDGLLEAGLNIGTVATDRHLGIRKLMKERYPNIDHQYDVWHVKKSVTKKLVAKTKHKECGDLLPWTKCITTHLWWCAANCREDREMIVEMWQSLTHHICDVHSWNSADKYHRCAHDELDPQRKFKWLTPGSAAHKALQEILFDKNLTDAIGHITKACHTGELESFHNMLLKYCPKRKHYHYAGMQARLQLAVLDHNHNTARKPAVIKKGPRKGEQKVALKYSKRTKEWVAKLMKEKKDYSYLVEILENILKMRSGEIEVETVVLPELPKNVAPTPRPSKEEVMARKYTRF